MILSLVCSEVNLTSVPRHTWWLDSAATTHISVSMQGCLSCRKQSDDERYIYVGDGNLVEVEAIGTFRLLLRTGFYLDLIETHVVLSLRRNLVLFLFWTHLVIIVHSEMENSFFIKIQIWLVLVLYYVTIIYIFLTLLLHLMNPCM